jgi:hypothetical protein
VVEKILLVPSSKTKCSECFNEIVFTVTLFAFVLFSGDYRVVYITPEFVQSDRCELLSQLNKSVGKYLTS